MLKSKLLASTILVSAAALVAAPAADAASLKLGGVAEFWVGVADQDKNGDAATDTINDYDVKTDMEIHFKAEETLDNGMKVGARLEMEAGNGNDAHGVGAQGDTGFDESYGWVKTKFGQIGVGNNDVAAAYVGGISVVGPVGIIKSDAGDWIPSFDQGLNNTDSDVGTGDANNVTYFTPRVGGVQLITSWTPDQSNDGASEYDDQETAGFHDVFSGAIKYGGKFGKVGVEVNAGLTHKPTSVGAPGGEDEDGHAFKVGLKFGPVHVTGAYAFENRATMATFYGGGVIVKLDKLNRVSAGFSYSEETDGGADVGDGTLVTVGFERKMGKGISFAASAFYVETDLAASDVRDGYGLVGGFKVGF